MHSYETNVTRGFGGGGANTNMALLRGGGGEEGVQSQILKKNRSKYFFLKNKYAKLIILKNSR